MIGEFKKGDDMARRILVATGAAALLLTMGGTAAAQVDGDPCPASPQLCPPPDVLGDDIAADDDVAVPIVADDDVTEPEVAVPAPRPQPPDRAGLPVTGSDVTTMAGLGVVLAAGGALLVRRSNRLSSAED
jgi:LPXTG-motif cell wall-anchored protein